MCRMEILHQNPQGQCFRQVQILQVQDQTPQSGETDLQGVLQQEVPEGVQLEEQLTLVEQMQERASHVLRVNQLVRYLPGHKLQEE